MRAVPSTGATHQYCEPGLPSRARSVSQHRHPLVFPVFVAASMTLILAGS